MEQPARRAVANSGKLARQVPRRILLLITDLKIGGTPTVVRELATRLHVDADFQVQVACLDEWGPVADQLRERGIEVTPLNARGSLDARILPRLIRLIREQEFHTVFSFLVHANAVAAAASRFLPGVRFLQSIQTTQPNPKWHWKIQRIAAGAAEKIVVPSPSVAQAAEQWSKIDPGKIVVIANAVDLGAVLPRQPHQGKRIGFIGRLDPVKRIGDLIDAISLLSPDISLEIFGEGSERASIEDHIRRLQLTGRVKLHGSIASPWQALAGIDLLVLPSEAEGFGLVLIEAMAAGVPVIGTDVPGIRDIIIHEKNGLLIPPSDPRDLANAMQRILSDEPLRERLVTGGIETVHADYDWSKIFGTYQRLLNL